MKITKYGLIFFLLIGVSYGGFAQSERDTLKILFVGNSYIFFSDIPKLASMISDSTNTKLVTSQSTAGGARLSEHYREEGGLKTKELIKNGNFDIVVLQEHSMGTIEHPDSFLLYSHKLCDYIKASGAAPFFYATWARKNAPEYQKVISMMYTQAAMENEAGIVYTGDAWALAQKQRPNIQLYLPDGSHQSSLGAFLNACLFVAAFSKEVPEKLPSSYDLSDSGDEEIMVITKDSSDIDFCLKIAAEISEK